MERVLNGRSSADADSAAAAARRFFQWGNLLVASLARSLGGRQLRFIAKTIIMLFPLFRVSKVQRNDSENQGKTLFVLEQGPTVLSE